MGHQSMPWRRSHALHAEHQPNAARVVQSTVAVTTCSMNRPPRNGHDSLDACVVVDLVLGPSGRTEQAASRLSQLAPRGRKRTKPAHILTAETPPSQARMEPTKLLASPLSKNFTTAAISVEDAMLPRGIGL